jgi:phage tail-like protein
MAVGARSDPFLSFSFLVEIDGLVLGGFSEVTGLQTELEVLDYREGGMNEYVHKVAGPARYPANLVLRRGLTDARALWEWQHAAATGSVERKSGSIVLLSDAGEEVWRWNFVDAYPVRWTGPELRAGSATVAVEALELAHRGLAAAGVAGA